MMTTMKPVEGPWRLAPAAFVLAVLAACGGGGSSDPTPADNASTTGSSSPTTGSSTPTSGNNANTSTGPGTESPSTPDGSSSTPGSGSSTTEGTDGAPVSHDPIDRYLGTYVAPCHVDNAMDAVHFTRLYKTLTTVIKEKSSATQASVEWTRTYYDDAKCTGRVRYTLKMSGPDNFFRVDAAVMASGKAAHKVTFGEGVYFPGQFTGNELVVDGIRFVDEPYNFRVPQIYKDLAWLDGHALYSGDFSKPRDADDYPTELDLNHVVMKQ